MLATRGKPVPSRAAVGRAGLPGRVALLALARDRPRRRPRAAGARHPRRRRQAGVAVKSVRALAPGAPLELQTLPRPDPGPGQALIQVSACGVCRTDLHIADGELPQCRYPVTPGHEVVGRVIAGGERFRAGTRVGVPWLAWTCG